MNPRLTTSYVGLRVSIRENLASLIVDAVASRALPERITQVGRCRFRIDGATEMHSMGARAQIRGRSVSARDRDLGTGKTWRIISAGTSAASI